MPRIAEWLTRSRLRFKALLLRRRFDRDLEAELEFHLAMRQQKAAASGLAHADARAAARRRFGNVTRLKEVCREMWTFTSFESFWKDVRYAARSLSKAPGFVTVVVLSLALGIGASTTIFSVINALIYNSLPYAHPQQLTAIWATEQGHPDSEDPPPIAELADWKKQNHVFSGIGLVSNTDSDTLSGIGAAEPVDVQYATPELFDVLGVQPAIGRIFRADEAHDESQTILISYSFWKTKFGLDSNVLGRTINVEGVPSTVVGIMPPGFRPLVSGNIDVWVPIDPDSKRYSARQDHWLVPVARLKPQVTLAQAQLEMDVIAKRLEQEYPDSNKGVGKKLVSVHEVLVQGAGQFLYPLFGAVIFVLLIGCVNVANLMQSRTETRQREFSVRASLGAGRVRLMQQLLAESGLLALTGGVLGVLLSIWGIRLFRALAPAYIALDAVRLDALVLAFALGISMMTALLFGLAPAIRASKPDLNVVLREGEGRTSTGSRSYTRHALVISEIALAMVLLVGAGLMINTIFRLQRVAPGFDASNLLTMAVNLPEGGKYLERVPGGDMEKTTPLVTNFRTQLLEKVAAIPGVASAACVTRLPTWGAPDRSFAIVGRTAPAANDLPQGGYTEISPSYFRAMKIPLKRGRFLDERDTASTAWAVVINETLAKRYFPSDDAIGQQVLVHYDPYPEVEPHPRQIVGIVGDVRQRALERPAPPMLYVSYLQQPLVFPGGSSWEQLAAVLVIRPQSDLGASESSLVAAVKLATADLDPSIPVTNIMSMEKAMDESISDWHFYVRLLGIFAAIAVALAMIGIYGVMSYSVNQRTREFGIRFALGAQRDDVLAMVARLGFKLVLAGVFIGAALSLALARLIARLLYGVSASDPLTYAVVGALLVAVALLACYIPARRATRVDPMVALRYE
jgi:putative ABC transport system permease protein